MCLSRYVDQAYSYCDALPLLQGKGSFCSCIDLTLYVDRLWRGKGRYTGIFLFVESMKPPEEIAAIPSVTIVRIDDMIDHKSIGLCISHGTIAKSETKVQVACLIATCELVILHEQGKMRKGKRLTGCSAFLSVRGSVIWHTPKLLTANSDHGQYPSLVVG
jgi:hypothetical protein